MARPERHPRRAVAAVVAGDAPEPRRRRPPAAAAAADPRVPLEDDRGDAAALPGARERAHRRLRRARRGRVRQRVRRALLEPHPLHAAGAAGRRVAAGRALGRRPRQVVRHQRAGRSAAHRGGARGPRRLHRARDRGSPGAPAGRPRLDAHRRARGVGCAQSPRAVGRAGVPRVRRHGDDPQPAGPRRPDLPRASGAVAAHGRAARARRARRRGGDAREPDRHVGHARGQGGRRPLRPADPEGRHRAGALTRDGHRRARDGRARAVRHPRRRPAAALRLRRRRAHCLGHFVARTDMSVALPLLAQRMPDVAADGPGEWLPVSGNTGPIRFPLRFTPTR